LLVSTAVGDGGDVEDGCDCDDEIGSARLGSYERHECSEEKADESEGYDHMRYHYSALNRNDVQTAEQEDAAQHNLLLSLELQLEHLTNRQCQHKHVRRYVQHRIGQPELWTIDASPGDVLVPKKIDR
jgi:hypothetical protein